jgi:hypothetical protein
VRLPKTASGYISDQVKAVMAFSGLFARIRAIFRWFLPPQMNLKKL